MRLVVFMAALAAILIQQAQAEVPHAPATHPELRPVLDEHGRVAPTSRPDRVQPTNAAPPIADSILVEADSVLQADGQLVGRVRTDASGASADLLRKFVGDLSGTPLARTSTLMMTRQAIEGQITALALMPEESATRQSAAMELRLFPIAQRDGRMSITTQPGPRLVRPILVNLVSHLREKRNADAPCPAQLYEHRIRIRLDGEWRNPILPTDAIISLAGARYESRYRVVDDALVIVRRLVIDTGLPICSPEAIAEMAPVIHAAARDFNRKIGFAPID